MRFSYVTIVIVSGLRMVCPAPLMACRAAAGSWSLARRPRARQTGWLARTRVAFRCVGRLSTPAHGRVGHSDRASETTDGWSSANLGTRTVALTSLRRV